MTDAIHPAGRKLPKRGPPRYSTVIEYDAATAAEAGVLLAQALRVLDAVDAHPVVVARPLLERPR